MVSSLTRETKTVEYSILTDEEWKKYYSNAQMATKYPIHHSIATNEPFETTQTKINRFAKQNPELLFCADNTPLKFTPLMIASMKANLLVVENLLANVSFENLNGQDISGYTAAHHAVPHPAIFQLFVKAKAYLEETNYLEGTPADLEKLITQPKFPNNHVFVQTTDGRLLTIQELINSNDLAKETNFKEYQDFQKLKPSGWTMLWLFPYEKLETKIAKNMKLSLNYGKHFEEKGSIKLCRRLMAGCLPQAEVILKKHSSLPESFGVYATSKGIKFKSNLGIFGGILEKCKPSSYSEGFVNAEEVGNIVSRVKAGFPNSYTFVSKDKGTIKTFMVVTQPEGIAPNEEVLVNFGVQSWSFLDYSQDPFPLNGQDRMKEFYKNGVMSIFQKLTEAEKKFNFNELIIDDEYLKFCDLREKFFYPLDNPTAIIYLHFSNIVLIKDWLKILDTNSPLFIKQWKAHVNFKAPNQIELLQKKLKFVNEIDLMFYGTLRKLVCEWVLTKLSLVGLPKLITALDLIGRRVEDFLNHDQAVDKKIWLWILQNVVNPFLSQSDDEANELSASTVTGGYHQWASIDEDEDAS